MSGMNSRSNMKHKFLKGIYVVVATTMLTIFVMFILSMANTEVPDATTSTDAVTPVSVAAPIEFEMPPPKLPEKSVSAIDTETEVISPVLPQAQDQQDGEQQQDGEPEKQEPPPMIETLSGKYLMEHYEFGRSVFTFSGNRVTHSFERSGSSVTKNGRYELLTGYELDWQNGEEVNGQNFPAIVPSTVGAEKGLIIIEFHWSNGTIEYAEFDRFGFIAPDEAIWWRAYPHFQIG